MNYSFNSVFSRFHHAFHYWPIKFIQTKLNICAWDSNENNHMLSVTNAHHLHPPCGHRPLEVSVWMATLIHMSEEWSRMNESSRGSRLVRGRGLTGLQRPGAERQLQGDSKRGSPLTHVHLSRWPYIHEPQMFIGITGLLICKGVGGIWIYRRTYRDPETPHFLHSTFFK